MRSMWCRDSRRQAVGHETRQRAAGIERVAASTASGWRAVSTASSAAGAAPASPSANVQRLLLAALQFDGLHGLGWKKPIDNRPPWKAARAESSARNRHGDAGEHRPRLSASTDGVSCRA
ncbi:MAG: hypothetical protein R3E87_12185 [Burkholderiaceae bacterium]